MKEQLLKLAEKIDGVTLRERIALFAATAASIVFVAYFGIMNSLLARQNSLRAQLFQNQNNISGIDAETKKLIKAFELDPDAESHSKLNAIAAERAALETRLREVQKGMVAPEKMSKLLESMLKSHGRLRLVSLKTLPVSGASENPLDAANAEKIERHEAIQRKIQEQIKAATAGAITGKDEGKPDSKGETKAEAKPAAPAKPPELLFRHGVELTFEGGYQDMVEYMAELEKMPSQLFWGKATLEVAQYPVGRLTLTLYTLSLDKKWMKL